MDKSIFLQLQYNTLREEIKETKARKFKLLMYGAVIFPTLYGASWKIPGFKLFVFAIPILVVVCTMIYIKQLNTIYRCGNYIRYYIEEEINCKDSKLMGWEEYLEDTGPFGRKSVDRLTQYCILILFIVYYLFSVGITAFSANKIFHNLKVNWSEIIVKIGIEPTSINIGTIAMLLFYLFILIIFSIYCYKSIRLSTERRNKVIESFHKRRKRDQKEF